MRATEVYAIEMTTRKKVEEACQYTNNKNREKEKSKISQNQPTQ